MEEENTIDIDYGENVAVLITEIDGSGILTTKFEVVPKESIEIMRRRSIHLKTAINQYIQRLNGEKTRLIGEMNGRYSTRVKASGR